jgi:hypothetical protein
MRIMISFRFRVPGEVAAGELPNLVSIEDFSTDIARERFLECFEKSVPSVLDSRHASTARLTQPMITINRGSPLTIGI